MLFSSLSASDSLGDDADMASVMGFSGFGMTRLPLPFVLTNVQNRSMFSSILIYVFIWFPLGKKARTFDLDAIFEQTRRTAIERSQRVLG